MSLQAFDSVQQGFKSVLCWLCVTTGRLGCRTNSQPRKPVRFVSISICMLTNRGLSPKIYLSFSPPKLYVHCRPVSLRPFVLQSTACNSLIFVAFVGQPFSHWSLVVAEAGPGKQRTNPQARSRFHPNWKEFFLES